MIINAQKFVYYYYTELAVLIRQIKVRISNIYVGENFFLNVPNAKRKN